MQSCALRGQIMLSTRFLRMYRDSMMEIPKTNFWRREKNRKRKLRKKKEKSPTWENAWTKKMQGKMQICKLAWLMNEFFSLFFFLSNHSEVKRREKRRKESQVIICRLQNLKALLWKGRRFGQRWAFSAKLSSQLRVSWSRDYFILVFKEIICWPKWSLYQMGR